MTLGGAAKAVVRLIIWCKGCQHQLEPDPAEQAQRHGAETSVLDWRQRLVCSDCGGRDIDMATYVDQGISGSKGRNRRPGFDHLLSDAIRRKFDLVAAVSVDRLGRSLQDLVGFLGEIRGAGVDLYLHKQAIDTPTPAGKALVPDDRRVQRIRGRHDPRADPRRAEPGSCRGKALGSDHRSTPLGPPRFAKLSPTSGGAMPYSTQSNSAASSARMNACVPVRRSSHKNRPS